MPDPNQPGHANAARTKPALSISRAPLTPGDVEDVARCGRRVEMNEVARGALHASRAMLDRAVGDGEAHYGINTGFGSLSQQRVSDAQLRDLQQNLIRSHAAGAGAPLPVETVRAMMLVLVASLARGYSGIRATTVETLITMLNEGLTPVVPSIGSVGASGDLAPLAHVALGLIGEGQIIVDGVATDASTAMHDRGVTPVVLEAKEGLALINGTHLMAGRAALIWQDFTRLFDAALAAAAMSIDACRATDRFLDSRVYVARNQPGTRHVADRLRTLMAGSSITPSHLVNDPRVQDPYSFRCVAPVLGAVHDAGQYVEQCLAHELGAVTDNPLIFESDGGDPEIVSAGNFHGMPIAVPLDVMAIQLSHIAGVSERRVYHMLSGFDPIAGLPPFLSPAPGLHSGLMIVQYTAAACCNELIGLANPASVANLSTSAGMEDYNSFGPRSADKAARGIELATTVVATELLCAAEAIEHHRPLKSGGGVEAAHARVRSVVPRIVADRPFADDIAAVVAQIRAGGFSSSSTGAG